MNKAGGKQGNIAAIDMGSNTMFLKIVNPATGEVLLDQIVFAQISKGTAQNGFISAEKVIKATETIELFKKLIEKYNVIATKGIATAVYRDTTNGADLITYLKNRFQLDLSIISGVEEAAFARRGAATDLTTDRYRLLDIGGRSTEITAVENGEVIFSHSYPFGTVSITEQFFSDPPTPAELQRASDFINNHLNQHKMAIITPLIGLGGSPTTLGAAALKLIDFDETEVNGSPLSRNTVSTLLLQYCSYPLDERRQLPHLDPRRADLIIAGALILEQVMGYGNDSTIQLSTRGVRDGVINQLMDRV